MVRTFIKTGWGGGSKAIYKLYKKTDKLVRDRVPKGCVPPGLVDIQKVDHLTAQNVIFDILEHSAFEKQQCHPDCRLSVLFRKEGDLCRLYFLW